MKLPNSKNLKLTVEKSTKISTYFGLTTTILVAVATLGMAIYALFFINDMFSFLVTQDELYNKTVLFKEGLQRLVFAFLIFSLIASYYMTKMVTRPLEEMIKGTKELAEGHLTHRLKKTNYLEINELIKTYNQMAENLQTLYDNLEQKVQERTVELETANNEIKSAQAMMVHSEKMRSLGQLVAGITHEINNPINFIYGNMSHLKNYSESLVGLIELYENFEVDLSDEGKKQISKLKEQIELDFLKEDLPALIKSCQDGTERTKNIILDLKNFSRVDEMIINNVDLEKEIDTTLNILHNKIKNRIDVVKDYEDGLPNIEGYGGQLNQVFMNILDNACYAIKDSGKIFIRLKKSENNVIIEFEDTGDGMNKEQVKKIFEPFYTTKPVGQGSGLGMSISYKVIKNHNGDIKVESKEGKGSMFVIKLPLSLPKTAVEGK